MTDETVADYDVRSPASRTLLTVIGTLLVAAVIGGLLLGTSILMRDTKVSTSVLDLGDSAQLIVDATSADIRVVEGDPGTITLTAKVTSGLRKTDYQVGRRGDVIKVASGCRTWLSPGCGVALPIEVPKGLPLVVNTTSGDVAASSVAKSVLTVTSGSGDVKVDKLGVDEFFAQTRSGDIDAEFASQPFAFKAVTTDGDIAASIPTGKRTYDVRATSKSGTVSSSIRSDAKGAGLILARTGAGDVRLRTR